MEVGKNGFRANTNSCLTVCVGVTFPKVVEVSGLKKSPETSLREIFKYSHSSLLL